MTREEAIELIDDIIGFVEDNHGRDYDEAFRMAIESLQREEAEERGWCHRIRPKNVEVVVRCKDCKSSRVYGKTTQWLACEDVMEGQATDPDGYCYLGERREESEVEE